MSDSDVSDMIDGIGLHGYTDLNVSSEMLNILHEKYKNKFIINTEFCFLRSEDCKLRHKYVPTENTIYYLLNTISK